MHHYDAHTTSGVIFIKYLSSIVTPTHVSELAAVLAGAGQLAGQAVYLASVHLLGHLSSIVHISVGVGIMIKLAFLLDYMTDSGRFFAHSFNNINKCLQ